MSRTKTGRRSNAEHPFPRYGPHVGWQQRWYAGTKNRDVLRDGEKPMRLTALDYRAGYERVRLFRTEFYKMLERIAERLRRFESMKRGGSK